VSDTLRAFFAADLAPAARERIAAAQDALRGAAPERVRWVEPEKLHLTLKFLGDVASEAIPKLAAGAASRLAGRGGFEVVLAGFGAFPTARAARVVWIGVRAGAAELARLARRLDAAAVKVGLAREHRPYRAHLTLGRLREPAAVALDRFPTLEIPPFRVDEVVLYESRPGAGGSRYVALAHLPLADADADLSDLAPES
jgi:2'-5' RNA ligase